MNTQSFKDVTSLGIDSLSRNLPFFILIIYMNPCLYIGTKMASEKE